MNEQQIQALRAAILQRWGNSGDWNAQGKDRALELAQLMAANGISDLDKLGMTSEANPNYVDVDPTMGARERAMAYGQLAPNYREKTLSNLTYDGRKLGFLGDVNDGGSLSKVGEQQYMQGFGPESLAGWSSDGHGHMNYAASLGADGKLAFRPEWGSSSNADEIQDIAKAAAIFFGGVYGAEALGGAEAGAGAIGGEAGIGVMPGVESLGTSTFVPETLAGSGSWGGAAPSFAGADWALPSLGGGGGLLGGGSGIGTMPGVESLPTPPSPGPNIPTGQFPQVPTSPSFPTLPSLPDIGKAAGALDTVKDLVKDYGKPIAGLLGAVAGAQEQPGADQTTTRKLDPRIDSMVFGADGKSGLLGDMNAWYQANKSGQNDVMRLASQRQQQMLTNPAVMQGLLTMGGRGMNMMEQGIASNPFAQPGNAWSPLKNPYGG